MNKPWIWPAIHDRAFRRSVLACVVAIALLVSPLAALPARGAEPGLWTNARELACKPTSGPAWSKVVDRARNIGSPSFRSYSNKHHIHTLGAAYVAVRTDSNDYRRRVRDALADARKADMRNVSVLGPARNMAAYVIAADLINLASFDRAENERFRRWIDEMRFREFSGGGDGRYSLVSAHERRPNNFGTSAGAARIAIDLYLGDNADLARAIKVFRGWLGDRSSYTGFSYGDLGWQADSRRPVGINPKGATLRIDGRQRNVDGVLPDDQRRSGRASWPVEPEYYAYVGLQGAILQAELLARRGYDAWNWSDRALLRATQWLHTPHFEGGRPYPPPPEAEWILPVLNDAYGSNYRWKAGMYRGIHMGFTDWSHGPCR